MSRKIWIAGNWKMNHSPEETHDFLGELRNHEALQEPSHALRIAVFPPFLSLSAAASAEVPHLIVGAQNAHWEESGAFTGEVSFSALKQFSIKTVLVGHSERRHLFGESNALIGQRTIGLLEAGATVILCVGETREQREANQTESTVLEQLDALPQEAPSTLDKLVIAYEPVWAIGTGLTATPAQAQEVHAFTRKTLTRRWGPEAAKATSILYGGSVKPDNIDELLSQPDVDGGLVGGASLKADSFSQLIEAGARAIKV